MALFGVIILLASTLEIHVRGVIFRGVMVLKQVKAKKQKKVKTPYDRHHIFYIRKEWNKGKLDKLRLHPYCIVLLDRDTVHRYLHTHLACIPAPSGRVVDGVLEQLGYLEERGAIGPDDCLEKRLIVLTALFECIAQPTADGLKEQLRLVREFYKKAPP